MLIGARIFGGLSAGMAYPTTLALITALWAGPARTKTIALWSALGGAHLCTWAPGVGIACCENFWWGSVFLVTLPLAVVALVMAWRLVPAHVNEGTEPVDNLGGVLSDRSRRRAGAGHQLRRRSRRRHPRYRPGG